jgi:hypothetical protein
MLKRLLGSVQHTAGVCSPRLEWASAAHSTQELTPEEFDDRARARLEHIIEIYADYSPCELSILLRKPCQIVST